MPTPRLTDEKMQEAVNAFEAMGRNQTRAAASIGLNRATFQNRISQAVQRGFTANGVSPLPDPELHRWATARQTKCLNALLEHGSIESAAEAMSLDPAEVEDAISSLRSRAAVSGHSPAHDMTHAVPHPFVVKGVSTYYSKDGKPTGQWVKSNLDQERFERMLRDAAAAFCEDVPRLPVPDGPTDYSTDLIPWIQIGDAHIGMLAHIAEVGENFDLKIAERELCGAIQILLDEMPACERLVINDLGDFTHYDNMAAVTAASGHPLDADGRHPRMLRVYSRTMRFIVDQALRKARNVDVIINQGNHSRINDFWMRELLTVAYGHTDRVNVLDNDSVFIPYRMGNTLVMVHHSDKCRPDKLVGVMTSDFRKDFGETEFHYIDTGHVHHHFVSKEHPSVVIESWNHLAASDKWAHDAGYRSRKAITVVLRSRTYGDVGRRLLSIQEVRARMGAATVQAKPVFTV